MIGEPVRPFAVQAAAVTGILLAAATVAGWWAFEFDAALLLYAQALVWSAVLTTYRMAIWVQRPPTWQMMVCAWNRGARWNGLLVRLAQLTLRSLRYFGLNMFIWNRGALRFSAHWPIMVGCLGALAIVLPLILGWVWFETLAENLHQYRVMLFGYPVRTIAVDGWEAFLMFHGLVWASFPVLAGVCIALWRRATDRGEQATQTWSLDWLPLLALLSIAVSGLWMTVSYAWMQGAGHTWVAGLHCAVVVLTLLWLPYSKLLHIPQRSVKLAQMIYAREAERAGPASCHRCGDAFAPRQQVEDLIALQRQLGFYYELADGDDHYQWICPRCRRATLVRSQGARWRGAAAAMPETELAHER